MRDLLSPKQVAQALGVGESSVKRWCDLGKITAIRTSGGHRRLALADVLRFVRESDQPVVRPEILGLPPARESERSLTRAKRLLVDALLAGDESLSRRIVFDLYLAKHTLSVVCDEVVAGAFREIGERWSCQQAEVYQERRACEIMLRILHAFRDTQRGMNPSLVAIGGTPPGDLYAIPNAIVELVLREAGWQAESLGTSLPFSSLAAAVRSQRPRLLWLSVTYVRDDAEFVAGYRELHDTARELGTAMVVGGQALGRELRQQMSYASFCDTVRQLDDFARAFRGSESVLRDRTESAETRSSENKMGDARTGENRAGEARAGDDRGQDDRAATIPIRAVR
jgi:excisionase family DNA binding protein